jgi:heme/copper-type cytochrome/quinol oxidase subunit 3
VLLVGASAVFGAKRSQLVISHALSLTFVIIKVLGDAALISKGITPSTDLMWACWFTLTGFHAVHVLGGAIWTAWLAGPAWLAGLGSREPGTGSPGPGTGRWPARIDATRRYWLFVDLVWLIIVISFYVV